MGLEEVCQTLVLEAHGSGGFPTESQPGGEVSGSMALLSQALTF